MLLFLCKALGLLLQPFRVVALPGNAFTAVQLQDPSRHIVEEIAVVRNAQYGSLIALQVLLQPIDGLCIQVVRRLVQQQHVRRLQQQATQGHPAALSTGQLGDFLVIRRTAQRIHRDVELGIQFPGIQGVNSVLNRSLAVHQRLHLVGVIEDLLIHELGVDFLVLLEDAHNLLCALFDHLPDRLAFVQLGLLRQITYGVPIGPNHLALIGLVQPRDDLHHGRLTGSIGSNDADFGAVVKGQVDVLENVFSGRCGLVDLDHREYDLLVVAHDLNLALAR